MGRLSRDNRMLASLSCVRPVVIRLGQAAAAFPSSAWICTGRKGMPLGRLPGSAKLWPWSAPGGRRHERRGRETLDGRRTRRPCRRWAFDPAARRGCAGLTWTTRLRSLAPADLACIGAYLVAVAYRLALLPVMPALLGTHPVLLEALQGSVPALVAAGAFARVGRASLWAALAAPLLGLTLFDPVIWWAGRRFGRRILDFYARRSARDRRWVAWLERLFRRWGPWLMVVENYLPTPNTLLYLLAGAADMPLPRFVVFDLAGAALWAVPMVGLGYAIGQRAVDVAGTISRYAVWFAIAMVALLFAYHALQLRRPRRGDRRE